MSLMILQMMLSNYIQKNLNNLELNITIGKLVKIEKLQITLKRFVNLKTIQLVKLLQNLEIWTFGMTKKKDINLRLKEKQKCRNQDINVKDMSNYRQVKKQLAKKEQKLEKANT